MYYGKRARRDWCCTLNCIMLLSISVPFEHCLFHGFCMETVFCKYGAQSTQGAHTASGLSTFWAVLFLWSSTHRKFLTIMPRYDHLICNIQENWNRQYHPYLFSLYTCCHSASPTSWLQGWGKLVRPELVRIVLVELNQSKLSHMLNSAHYCIKLKYAVGCKL